MPTAWGSRSATSGAQFLSATTVPTAFQSYGGDFTASIWANTNSLSTTGNELIYSMTDGAFTARGFFLSLSNSAGTTKGYVNVVAHTTLPFGSAISTGVWHHFVVTHTSTNWTIYIDGSVSAGPTSIAYTAANAGDSTFINAGTPSVTQLAADAALWTTGLSASEITALSKGARPNTIRSASLKFWAPCDGLQSPEPDISGVATPLNLTLNGSIASAFGPPYSPFTPRWPQAPRIFLPQDGNWGSRSFNGTSNVITLASPINTNSVAISAWANFTNLATAFSPIVNHDNGVNNIYYLGNGSVANLTKLNFSYLNSAGQSLTSSNTLSTGVWTHCFCQYDSATHTAIIYINGVSGGTNTTGTGNLGTTANATTIGNYATPSTQNPCQLADVAMWSIGTLTASEVNALAKGARPNTIRPTSLLGWWPLDGLQSPEEDLSGKANNGTLTGTLPAFGPPYMPLTPRWPQRITEAAAITFNPAWARGKNIVIEGVAT